MLSPVHSPIQRAHFAIAMTLLWAASTPLGAAPPTTPSAPIAVATPHAVVAPFGTRDDPYYWLRDDGRQSDAAIALLTEENRYARASLDHLRPSMGQLYVELRGRTAEADCNVPYTKRGLWFQTCTRAGLAYPVHLYSRRADSRKPESLLDLNELAAGHRFFSVGSFVVSPDGRYLAWTEDRVGQRRYLLRIRELATGREISEPIADVEPTITFADNGVLYIRKDSRTLLGNQVLLHVPGQSAAGDRRLYTESDPTAFLTVKRTRSDRFMLIGSSSTAFTEWRFARASDPELAFQVIYPRENGHEYDVEDHGKEWLLLSNWRADNFSIFRAPIDAASDRSQWQEWLAGDTTRLFETMAVMQDAAVISERSAGLKRLRVKYFADGAEHLIQFPDQSYAALPSNNPEQASQKFRLVYSALNTPSSIFEYDLKTQKLKLLKREPVPDKRFKPGNYVSELHMVPARDGRQIPVSLLYRKRAGARQAATLITGYGAYGTSTDPVFNGNRLSLVDRGMLFVIAHVRGGQEMGREWYQDGRHLNKLNSFYDFLDVTDWLVREGRSDPKRIVAQGGSAGGLLVAGVANMAPNRYRAIIANVPFVDVVTSMLDANLPLTANEYGEWGNPMLAEDYAYMLRYSPYDNVTAQAYPNMMVTTGLFDTQVPYWGPAKWVTKLRRMNQGDSRILLMTNMFSGHVGNSGRYQRLKDVALNYAYIFDQVGIKVHITSKRHVDWPKRSIDGAFLVYKTSPDAP
ncbi:S9 family peptidase [Ahniella affigens]|nr:S9 family peptidase [Ahniella affigens]